MGSFSIDFVAQRERLESYIDAEHAPECVKTFIKIAVSAFQWDGQLVHVKARGHLSDNGNAMSACEMSVTPIIVRA